MSFDRYLIVNADDFGRSAGVNRGIGRAHEEGIVTSASLMVRWPAAAEAAAYAREHPALSVGLHFDLAEWSYGADGWAPVYERAPVTDAAAVEAELDGQLRAFRELVGREPSHLDSHQHVHRREPVRSLLVRAAAALGGKSVRDVTAGVRYCGSFHGQTREGDPLPNAVSVDALLGLLASLPPGATELSCHPGDDVDLESAYIAERAQETRTLCDPRVRATLEAERIALLSFHDVLR
jgi:predicted glycoside hydrolase/deacetylase ChbG (UPF0249 family)